MTGDAIEAIEAALDRARTAAARAVDRAEALAELHSLAIEAASRAGRTSIELDDLEHTRRTEEERARLAALITRARPEETP